MLHATSTPKLCARPADPDLGTPGSEKRFAYKFFESRAVADQRRRLEIEELEAHPAQLPAV
jgi:hypothetical protein